ncbi:MAG: T9SS type A sorting domain-containing protein [Candidatus Cloacimonetes bacterium]|nr:T9SS type A sorting domain-containing protein [Candidatus Cloacimonadota bacterium]
MINKNRSLGIFMLVTVVALIAWSPKPTMADEIVWEYTEVSAPRDADRLSDGNTLITDPSNAYQTIFVVSPDGTIVWAYSQDTSSWDVDRLSNGNTLIAGDIYVFEVTSDNTIVWQYPLDYGSRDADRLSNGNTLIVDDISVFEVTSDGSIVWEYSTGLNSPYAADRLSNGNTLITDKNNNRVIEITSGFTIVWEYSTGLNRPYDAERISNGNTLITDRNNHRVIEVTSDGAIVWEYSTGLSYPLDADRLSNGNTLITDYYNGRIIEVGLIGDFNADHYVDGADLLLFGDHWHFTDTHPDWDPLYDLVPDNIIDAADLQVFGDHWHEGTPPTRSGQEGRGPNENAGIVFDLDATTTGNQNLTGIPSQPTGTYIRVDVYCTDVQNLDTYEFEVIYNPSELEYVSSSATNPITFEGNILESNGGTALGWMIDSSTPGVLSIAYTLAGTDTLEAPEGEGLIADIVFLSLVDTYGTLSFGDVYYYDSYGVVDLITDKGTASIGGVTIPPGGGTVTFPAGGSITFPPGGSGTIDLIFDDSNPPPGIPVGNPQTLWWDFDTSLATIVYPVTLRLEWPFDAAVAYASSAVLHQTEAVWYALIDGNPIPAHAANLLNQAAILASITYDFGIDPSFVEFDTWTLSDWGMDGDNPLPVTLTNFAAEFVADNLTIMWATQSESSNMGWNIYRGESDTALEEDNTILINVELIGGAGTTSEPTNYEFIDEYPVQVNETYCYWLESVSYSNDTGIYGPISLTIPEGETPPPLPTITLLKGNYPNPFNPTTFIQFDIKEGETAELTIFNIRGQIVESKTFEAGAYNYEWNSKDNASGVYFYKLKSESYSEFKKMMLLK